MVSSAVMATIRPIRDDELETFLGTMTTGFQEHTDVAKVAQELRPLWDLQRVLAAFDGTGMVGTFRSWATEVTVPGGAQLPASAVAAVTVLPTHRRQGILRALVAHEHSAIHERGEAISLLYASEYPIYGRFGYGSACRWATWSLDARGLRFVDGQMSGTIELQRPTAETRDACRAVFESHRRLQAGEIRRRDVMWELDFGLREDAFAPGESWKGWVAVHRDGDGAIDGYLRYHAEPHWEAHQPRNRLQVDELHALTQEAYAALWTFATSVDWVATVTAERRSPTERLPWLLTNARAAQVSEVSDGMWLRLHDIPRALEARTYDHDDALVLEVIDEERPGGRQRVRVDASTGGTRCRPSTRAADLTLHVSALAAAYLGGPRLTDTVLARGADEGRRGALVRAERLLRRPDEPWCSTFF